MDAATQHAWAEYEAAGRALDRAKDAMDRPAIDQAIERRLEALERYQTTARQAEARRCTDCRRAFVSDDPEQDCCADCLLSWLAGVWDLRLELDE